MSQQLISADLVMLLLLLVEKVYPVSCSHILHVMWTSLQSSCVKSC